jgi:carbon monoxide dehydrogenase subunit G
MAVKKEVKSKVAAKPVAKAKPSTAKSASKAKATKAEVKKPEVKAPVAVKAKKVRGPNKAKGSFADLIKIQHQYEEAKKGAKAELKKEFDAHLKEADKIKAEYKQFFSESIESAPKSRGVGAKKTSGKIIGFTPFTLKEVEDFVDQKKEGITIKIQGRRPKSIARLEAAYSKSDDAETILKILNQ